MYITLKDTFDSTIEKAIQIAKENNLDVLFLRDGEHGTDDLRIILKFHEAGFLYRISTYKGKYEDKAIKVEFHYIKEN